MKKSPSCGRFKGQGSKIGANSVIKEAVERLAAMGGGSLPGFEFIIGLRCLKIRKPWLAPWWLRKRLRFFFDKGWGGKALQTAFLRLIKPRKRGAIFALNLDLARKICEDFHFAWGCLEGMIQHLPWVKEAEAYPEFEVWLEGDKIAFRKIR